MRSRCDAFDVRCLRGYHSCWLGLMWHATWFDTTDYVSTGNCTLLVNSGLQHFVIHFHGLVTFCRALVFRNAGVSCLKCSSLRQDQSKFSVLMIGILSCQC